MNTLRRPESRTNKKGPLFRAAIGGTGKLSDKAHVARRCLHMVRRRAKDAELETAIGNHSFRAIGITVYLKDGGDINIAKAHGRALQHQNHGTDSRPPSEADFQSSAGPAAYK